MTENRKKLVELKNVSLTFNEGKKNEVKAINNVSFDIYEGEVFGLVGESGSGKTTVGRAILKLYDISGGEIDFNGETVSNLKGKKLHEFRKNVQMIFQDPQASLNARMKIRDIEEISAQHQGDWHIRFQLPEVSVMAEVRNLTFLQTGFLRSCMKELPESILKIYLNV